MLLSSYIPHFLCKKVGFSLKKGIKKFFNYFYAYLVQCGILYKYIFMLIISGAKRACSHEKTPEGDHPQARRG
jgi:hypothetical protein